MKLSISQPELYNTVQSFLRKLDKRLLHKIVDTKAGKIDFLIVLSNGREDVRVVALLCHHLNGNKTANIVKPTVTRYEAISELKEQYIRKYRQIVFIIDQEGDDLATLRENVRKGLAIIGVSVKSVEDPFERVLCYDCSLGDHEFRFMVVVSGLDNVKSPTHSIEDHLVMLAGVVGGEDSKELWIGLGRDERLEVFRRVYESKDDAEKFFRQHFDGLGLLEC
jgi:hypothetical protein